MNQLQNQNDWYNLAFERQYCRNEILFVAGIA